MSACPEWTVRIVLFSPEETDWHGTAWEFFDKYDEAVKCADRHAAAGNQASVVPCHAGHICHLGKPGVDAIGCPTGLKGEQGETGSDWDVCQYPGCDEQAPSDVPGPPSRSPWVCLTHRYLFLTADSYQSGSGVRRN